MGGGLYILAGAMMVLGFLCCVGWGGESVVIEDLHSRSVYLVMNGRVYSL